MTDLDTTARRAARDSGRHPAGRRLITRAVITLGAAGMLATAAPGVASARPVHDTTVECGPGYRARGAECVQTIIPPERGGTVGEWALAILGVGVLVVLA